MNSNRRAFIKKASLGSIVASCLPFLHSEASPVQRKIAKRLLRVAHITDVHILDQRNAEVSFARVVADINALSDAPDLILNTGDTVMDENNQTKEVVSTRWNTWQKIIQGNKIKMYSALGNHDVWYGPGESLDNAYKKEKRYGKQWAIELLSMPDRFYSFEAKGWQFIALDSINGTEGYSLDDAQFEWLQGELKHIPKERPICVFNHVPIMSIGAMLYHTQRTPIAEVKFPSADMHLDHQRIKNLFFKHRNVKLCISGHVHYVDSIEYLGVKYQCNGAVSGNWWRDSFVLDEFPPVYSIIDLFDDGTSECQSIYYQYQV
ncbi:MAG TPA: metallophosphoesterase [Chryseolinea sp.]|nr:metallophosphoesterase [Chryseolinea sp.]